MGRCRGDRGDPFTRSQRTWFAALSLLLIAVTMLYQALFMLCCPGRTLEYDVKPPVSAKRAHLAWLVTPSSRLGSRAIGLFMLLPSAVLFWFGLVFLSA